MNQNIRNAVLDLVVDAPDVPTKVELPVSIGNLQLEHVQGGGYWLKADDGAMEYLSSGQFMNRDSMIDFVALMIEFLARTNPEVK